MSPAVTVVEPSVPVTLAVFAVKLVVVVSDPTVASVSCAFGDTNVPAVTVVADIFVELSVPADAVVITAVPTLAVVTFNSGALIDPAVMLVALTVPLTSSDPVLTVVANKVPRVVLVKVELVAYMAPVVMAVAAAVPVTSNVAVFTDVVARIVPVVIELATIVFILDVPLTPSVPVVTTSEPSDPDKLIVPVLTDVAVMVPRVESVDRNVGVEIEPAETSVAFIVVVKILLADTELTASDPMVDLTDSDKLEKR